MNEKLRQAIQLLDEFEMEHKFGDKECVRRELNALKEKVGWIDLEECPFCHSTIAPEVLNLKEIDGRWYDAKAENYAANCRMSKGGCGSTGGYRMTKEEAAEAWNRRAK